MVPPPVPAPPGTSGVHLRSRSPLLRGLALAGVGLALQLSPKFAPAQAPASEDIHWKSAFLVGSADRKQADTVGITGRGGAPVTRTLAWREVARGSDEATWRTEIPSDYLFYEGHFEGYPVLAGGVQLHELVLPRLRAAAGDLPALKQLDGVKFLARFVPGDTVDVTLRRLDDPQRVTFEVRRGETRCTTGRMSFAAPVAALDRHEVEPS